MISKKTQLIENKKKVNLDEMIITLELDESQNNSKNY